MNPSGLAIDIRAVPIEESIDSCDGHDDMDPSSPRLKGHTETIGTGFDSMDLLLNNLNGRMTQANGHSEANGTRLDSGLSSTLDREEPNGSNGPSVANPSIMVDGRHDADENIDMAAPPPIAIVGMGMRLPGAANDESAFWDLLVRKKDGRCRVPGDRYNIDAFHSPSGKPGTVRSQYGYFLENMDLHHLDASFFSMNKTEVEKLDPQQRMLLEVVWECMENGGQVGWRGGNIGCYVGSFGEDWLEISAKETQSRGMYRITGSGDFALSNRVSYEYNLRGPRCVEGTTE